MFQFDSIVCLENLVCLERTAWNSYAQTEPQSSYKRQNEPAILRAAVGNDICSAGAGEVEDEPRGRGFQRGYRSSDFVTDWMALCATTLLSGLFSLRAYGGSFTEILGSVTASDFLHRAYAATQSD